MSIATRARAPVGADVAGPRSGLRVLVLYEPGRTGDAALREGLELTPAGDELTVVTLAPQSLPSRCCGPGPGAYNGAVREEAALELEQARAILGPAAKGTTFKALIERRDPPLARWVAEQAFQLVLLPGHRHTPGGHRAARRLRRSTAADVRIVG